MTKRRTLTEGKKFKNPSLEEIGELVSGRTIRMDEQDLRFLNCIGDIYQIPLKDVIKKIIRASLENEEFLKEIESTGLFDSQKIDEILHDVQEKINEKNIHDLADKFKEDYEYENYIEETFNYLMTKIEKRLKKEDIHLNATTLLHIYPEKVRAIFNEFYSKIIEHGSVRLGSLDIEFLTALSWLIDNELLLTSLPYKEHPEILKKLEEELTNYKASYFRFDQYFICQYEYSPLEEKLDNYDIKSIYNYLKEREKEFEDFAEIHVKDLVECYRKTLNYSKEILINKF